MAEITVENGTLEFAPSPDYINLIADEDGAEDEAVELRLSPSERDRLALAMERDEHLDLEQVDGSRGLVAWEPDRGLYVEEYGGAQFYLVLSPEQREEAVRAAREVEPGMSAQAANPGEDTKDYTPEFFLYHSYGPRLRATFSSANDAYVWQQGNVGRRWADLFFITNREGEKVTLKDQRHHPGHAYAILDALDRA